jgi:hypothetical protein
LLGRFVGGDLATTWFEHHAPKIIRSSTTHCHRGLLEACFSEATI